MIGPMLVPFALDLVNRRTLPNTHPMQFSTLTAANITNLSKSTGLMRLNQLAVSTCT